jgi:hypothetical protein
MGFLLSLRYRSTGRAVMALGKSMNPDQPGNQGSH